MRIASPSRSGVLVVAGLLACLGPPRLALAAQADPPAVLTQPSWKVGDSWVVETSTPCIQNRSAATEAKPLRVRWEFRVAKVEPLAGQDCYKIEVQCLAKGRLRPQATVWCDRNTLFLRQFQTQFAFNGQYRTVNESYACSKGPTAPVVTFVNVLPLALPAFMPAGAKGTGTFSYVSQSAPAGSKAAGVVPFAHALDQDAQPASAKALEKLTPAYSKNLDGQAVVEVKLKGPQQQVVQLWQPGEPWPIYTSDGRTQAWLVSKKSAPANP